MNALECWQKMCTLMCSVLGFSPKAAKIQFMESIKKYFYVIEFDFVKDRLTSEKAEVLCNKRGVRMLKGLMELPLTLCDVDVVPQLYCSSQLITEPDFEYADVIEQRQVVEKMIEGG